GGALRRETSVLFKRCLYCCVSRCLPPLVKGGGTVLGWYSATCSSVGSGLWGTLTAAIGVSSGYGAVSAPGKIGRRQNFFCPWRRINTRAESITLAKRTAAVAAADSGLGYF